LFIIIATTKAKLLLALKIVFLREEALTEQVKNLCQKVSLPDEWWKRKQLRKNYRILNEKVIIGSNSCETELLKPTKP